MSDNIQEAEVGSGTKVADTKQSEKRAQLTLKAIQLRLKQEKERSALQQQKKSLQVKENIGESFSPSQIAALKAEYSKINGIDPASDTYKKLIAMLDRLDLKSLQSLAGAEIKFVSGLAKNRVARKSMKKEEVEIDEGSGPKEKQTSKYVDRNSAESKAKVQAAKDRMVSDKKAEAGKALLSKLKKEEVQLDELSTNKLADYKKKAGADASAADKAGDMKRGNKRFSGIMKATRKQFGNDAKQKTEELSPKQKEIDKNKNGKIDGFDLAHLRKKNEELSPKQKELDKNKNGKIDGTDLAHLRSKKKQPQGADFAAQRRKERMASNGRMDEAKSDYEVYHKDYSGAVQTAIKQAEKRGYEVDMDDWHDKVATGPKKPSSGKTNSFSVNLMKDGKPSKKKLQMQVYNMDNHKYELNMYIEEVQQGVAEGVSLKQKYEDKKRLDQDQVHYGKMTQAEFDKKWTRTERPKPTDKKQGNAAGKVMGEETEQGVAENVAGDVNSKKRYHFLYPHVPLDMHKDHEYNKLSDRDLQAVKSHQRELADKLGKPGAEKQSDIASHIQINRARSQYDQEQAHRRKVLDAEKIKRQAREAKRKQQGVAEGSETAADIDKKIEFHKQGQAAAQYKGSMNKMHAAKIRELEAKKQVLKQGVAEEVQELDELNKDTLHSYAKKSEKDQDDQFNKIGKGIRDKDPKSANKAGHKFSMRSIGQNRAEKRLAKEAASPAQQAAIAIAMKKDGKEPKDRLPKKPADEYERKVVKYLKKKHGMSEGLMDKIKAIKRGMQAKAKADDHFDKAGDPKNANASKDLKKAVRYHNLLNKEETEIVTEARKKSFKDVKKKIKTEETPNGSTVKKGEALTGKREPIEINPELKEPAR